MVREFHNKFGAGSGDPTQASLDLIPQSVIDLRCDLIEEEATEATDAIAERDYFAVAKELADLVYVTYGAALRFGIDLDAALREVHRSNMTKVDDNGQPQFREDGKVLKGPNYRPADMLAALSSRYRDSLDASRMARRQEIDRVIGLLGNERSPIEIDGGTVADQADKYLAGHASTTNALRQADRLDPAARKVIVSMHPRGKYSGVNDTERGWLWSLELAGHVENTGELSPATGQPMFRLTVPGAVIRQAIIDAGGLDSPRWAV